MKQVVNRKQEFEKFKQQVCKLLAIDEHQYAELQYKAGCQYLQSYIPHDPSGIDQLLAQSIYWTWWRNHWAMRDEQFCVGHVESLSLKLRTDLYKALHDPHVLAAEMRPNGIILRMAYAGMIQHVHKSILTQ